MDPKEYLREFQDHLKANSKTYYLILILFVVLVFLIVSFLAIKSIFKTSITPQEFVPASLATPSQLFSEVTPIPSDQWRVKEVLGKQNINGYNALVIVFENVSSLETKMGQCQQPVWPVPEVGHLYRLVNTYTTYWLFIPIEGVDSTFQRFAPLP